MKANNPIPTARALPRLSTPALAEVSPLPIDKQALLERCMGDASFALMLLDELEGSALDHARTLATDLDQGATQGLAETAHALKGAAAIVAAKSLREQAARVEHAGRDGQLAELVELVSELRVEINRCVEYLPKLRTELQSN